MEDSSATPESDLPQLFEPAFYQCPHAVHARLRQEDPVHRVVGPGGPPTWVVTGYDDVRAVFTDRRLRRNLPKFVAEFHGIAEEEGDSIGFHLGIADPPEHGRLRKLVAVAFAQYGLETLRPRVEARADELLDQLAGRTETDLIAALAWPLPLAVSCDLFGLPEGEEREVFVNWAKAMAGLGTGEPDEYQKASFAVRDRLADLWVDRRANPRDDMLTALAKARHEGDRLSEAEFVNTAWVLMFAGMETSVCLLGNALYLLMAHRDQLEKLRNDRSLLEDAIEEVLRFEGPVNLHVPRIAVEPTRVGDVDIAPGDLVQVSLAAANRDPRKFPEPDVFDITRVTRGHAAFGHGAVFCLGASIARMEAQIVVDKIIDLFPGMRLAVDPGALQWRHDPSMRRLLALPTLL